jgi:adenylate cyclase class IV
VFLLKNARIHLDKVDRLGSFIEFEVIVRSGLRQARAMMKRLTKSFALEGQRSLAFSYSDLMLRNGKTRS